MTVDWREQFEAFKARLGNLRARPKTAEPATKEAARASSAPATSVARALGPAAPPRPRKKATVSINLGIDFGTSFTKVCFRDVGTEESGLVTFGASRAESAMVPTIVTVADDGFLTLEDGPARKKSVAVRYLKMRVAGLSFGAALPEVAGIDLNGAAPTRAMAAWFLAAVIERSQEWIEQEEHDRLKGRDILWSANVGVPVEHYDSPALQIFREVLAVAWQWAMGGERPTRLPEAIESYRAAARTDRAGTDCHAIPEIAAAVQSFVMSREALPGIYVYFDIGGGTLDGVAFDYLNRNGERSINFYSGKVEALGLSAIAERIGVRQQGAIASKRLDTALQKCSPDLAGEIAQKLRQCIAYVIMTAKRKDGRNWQEAAVQHPDIERKNIGHLDPKKMRPLVIFLGGGGASSTWYRWTIESTYERFGHRNAGIPPYLLREVPKPGDLALNGLPDAEFRRFAISYGLSVAYGEGPEVRLPSQFDDAEPAPRWRPPTGIDYADSKDVC